MSVLASKQPTKLYLCIYIFSDGEVNIFMEYMDGGSLDLIMKKMGRIHEPYTRKITHAVS